MTEKCYEFLENLEDLVRNTVKFEQKNKNIDRFYQNIDKMLEKINQSLKQVQEIN